ncbi:MAG TPA: hypothetical protein VJU15_06275 [Gemmatimonadales bacterium]|nr:hypothetical protein [Gemmatimonadales bacterium]
MRSEWIGVAGRLARAYAGRGQHMWVFRHPGDPELHLEFREGSTAASLAPVSADERALDGRLASLGAYEHTDVVWEGVTLPTGD